MAVLEAASELVLDTREEALLSSLPEAEGQALRSLTALARARGHVSNPEAFLLIAEDAGDVVGMALGVQALSDDGAGAPVRGLCHVSMVFVAPDYWGRGIGGRLVDALLPEARSRGYDRAQLWTQSDNARARRLYEGRGFVLSGREKDEFGERIVHYQRAPPETV